MSKDGISVIICCYNSAATISTTLEYLFRQIDLDVVPWEILVVDNLCTDDTHHIVSSIFSEHRHYETKIVVESTSGLMAARMKGVETAQYSVLLFCDDDNFLCNNYLYRCYQTLQDPHIGACSGVGYPIFTEGITKPEWFDIVQGGYACGKQMVDENDTVILLYGAGICIKKSVFDILSKNNFEFFLIGRKGDILLSGDDSELCFYIRMMGLKLAVVTNCTFGHFIPQKRIQITYLKRIFHGFGMAVPVIDIYYAGLRNYKIDIFHLVKQYIKTVFFLIRAYLIYLEQKSIINQVNLSVQLGILKGYRLFRFSDLVDRYNDFISYRNKISKS